MKKRLLFLFSLLLLVGNVVAQDYSVYETGAHNRSDRLLKNVSLRGSSSAQQKVFAADMTTYNAKLYYDVTETNELTVSAGETLTVDFSYNGSWMHSYVFIDKDGDGFTASVDGNYLPLEDLASFSCYGDDEAGFYNSRGENVQSVGLGNLVNACPSFKAPETPGTYRIRFKVDWNSIDPKGNHAYPSSNTLVSNGGAIIDAKLIVTDEVVDPTPEPSALPDPIEASAFVAGKVYLIKNVAANKFLYNEGNAIKVGNIADLTNIPSNCLFTAVEVTGGVALKASNGEYLPSTGASGTALTTAANPSAVNLSAKGGTYPSTTLNVLVGAAGNYWNIVGGTSGSELCFYNDVNDPNGVWEFRIMGDASTEGPDPEAPVVITDVAQLSNAKCYTLVSSDTGRGGMYALADKVDMCGVTYNAGTDACHSVALDNADPKQQFAFVEYEGKLYLYSVSEKKFVMKSGDTNALVGEAPFEHVVVEKVGENTFALQANGTHYFTASPGWCANPQRGTCIQSTLDSHSSDNGWDNGAWYTITEVADFDATEALAMLAPATETPEALELLSIDPADGSELESVNKFTFTFNKPVTIGEEGGVTLSANGGTTTLEVIASDEETSVVTFTTGKEITVSGDYELKVAAGTFVDADGNANEAMTFKYKVVSTANTLTLVSTNPSTDKVQTSLKRITLTFSEEVFYFDDVTINVTDEGGNVVTTGILDYGLNYEDMDVVLNDAITTPGKYTVTIPETACLVMAIITLKSY